MLSTKVIGKTLLRASIKANKPSPTSKIHKLRKTTNKRIKAVKVAGANGKKDAGKMMTTITPNIWTVIAKLQIPFMIIRLKLKKQLLIGRNYGGNTKWPNWHRRKACHSYLLKMILTWRGTLRTRKVISGMQQAASPSCQIIIISRFGSSPKASFTYLICIRLST